MTDLDRLEALARAATRGEWKAVPPDNPSRDPAWLIHSSDWGFLASVYSGEPDKANAAYIAAANPQVVLELIDRLRAEHPSVEELAGLIGSISKWTQLEIDLQIAHALLAKYDVRELCAIDGAGFMGLK